MKECTNTQSHKMANKFNRLDVFLIISISAIIWLSSFGTIFLNGDDPLHFRDSWRDLYFPALESSWIPNRVMDTYGRSLFVRIFNFIYSPINTYFHIDFFTLNKILTASIYTVFFVFAYAYFIAKANFFKNENNPIFFTFLLKIFIGLSLAFIFSWDAQYMFFAYQLPAFLSFIFLYEVSAGLYGSIFNRKTSESNNFPRNYLCTLSFICAFSSEVYAAIILITLLGWGLICYLSRKNNLSIKGLINNFKFVYYLSIFFCLSALTITYMFSQRITVTLKKFSLLENYFLLAIKNNISHIYLYTMICCLVLTISSLLYFKIRKVCLKFNQNNIFIFSLLNTLLIVFSTICLAQALSAKSSVNYFTQYYIFLISTLSALLIFTYFLLFIGKSFKISSLLSLLLFISLTKMTSLYLDTITNKQLISRQIDKALELAISGKSEIIDTGLDLETFPIRILPGPNQPEFFNSSYKYIFIKYYNLRSNPNFY